MFAQGLKRLNVERDKLANGSTFAIRNRQHIRRVNVPLLREITEATLTKLPGVHGHELCLHLVAAPEISRLNEQFLGHKGSTDVITFDYSDHASRSSHPTGGLHGEIFICLEVAVAQARQFGTTWQSELVRYVIHGLLHLSGYDDLRPPARITMKREENRLLRQISGHFVLAQLAKPSVRRTNRKS